VEGIPKMLVVAVLLWYLAGLVFGITSVVAFGLLIARLTKAARILFAAGLLCLAVATAAVSLSGVEEPERIGGEFGVLMIVMSGLSLLIAGVGQFVAAFRSPRTYAAALGCALLATVFMAAFTLSCMEITADVIPFEFPAPALPLAVASMLAAVASLMIAALFPSGFRRR
jgi:hypothetical protein